VFLEEQAAREALAREATCRRLLPPSGRLQLQTSPVGWLGRGSSVPFSLASISASLHCANLSRQTGSCDAQALLRWMICLFTNASMTGTSFLVSGNCGVLVLAGNSRRHAAYRRTASGSAVLHLRTRCFWALAGSFFRRTWYWPRILRSISRKSPVAGGPVVCLIGHAVVNGGCDRNRIGPATGGRALAGSHKLAALDETSTGFAWQNPVSFKPFNISGLSGPWSSSAAL